MKKSLQILLPVLIIGLLVGLYFLKNSQENNPSATDKPQATVAVATDSTETQSAAEAPIQEGILEMIDEYDLAAWKAENKPLLIEFSTDS